MKIVNPNDTTHVIKLIQRFEYDGLDLDLILKDEFTLQTINVPYLKTVYEGIYSVQFDYNFEEAETYEIKLTDTDGVVFYKGRLLATDQSTQDYQVSKGYYNIKE